MLRRIFRLFVRHWKTLAILLFVLGLESVYHSRSYNKPLLKPLDEPFGIGCIDASSFPTKRANATLFMLARNEDLKGAKSAISSVERRLNHRANYPLIVLNDQSFTSEFEEGIRSVASGNVTFAVIPKDMWGYPSKLNWNAAQVAMKEQAEEDILYGNLSSYHYMCRFNSGFFFDMEALQKYRWYWRIEPDVEFTCDITYDPFIEMENRGKKYGYVIALWELYKTAPSLFRKVSDYKNIRDIRTSRLWTKLIKRSHLPWPLRSLLRVSSGKDTSGDEWNLCHFWSNFEIADMDWYRSKEYRDFFEYLDQDGGFFFERWGDAPVHTFAAALLLKDHELHHFQDWGYVHPPFQYIPTIPIDQVKSTPMRNLQYQTIEEWSKHSKIIGCNCDIDLSKGGIVRPNCMNTVMEAFT